MSKAWATLAIALVGLAAATSASAAQPPEWTQPVKPFRIAPHVYYVGSKGLAAYLITGRDGAILIDGTLEQNASFIERNIEAVGVPLKSVKWILSDHAHSDHVGALAQIKADSGAMFAASAGDRVALERGVPRGDTDYDLTGYHFPPVKVDRIIRVLFLCSITVAGNTLVGNRAYPGIASDYEATFAKLSKMQADIVLTSHPEMADVLGREARVGAGDPRAFIDPKALPTIVAQARRDFEAALAKARRAVQ
jgi:metallo-beta-lactamase class B